MSDTATKLSPKEEALAQRVALLVAPIKPGPVLTVAESIVYTKHESDSAFYRWCARWKVPSCAQGRYARGQLDRGLLREANNRRASKAA